MKLKTLRRKPKEPMTPQNRFATRTASTRMIVFAFGAGFGAGIASHLDWISSVGLLTKVGGNAHLE